MTLNELLKNHEKRDKLVRIGISFARKEVWNVGISETKQQAYHAAFQRAFRLHDFLCAEAERKLMEV